ncbi:hypothetical protein I302_104163 [Kwoniella bestiolae CBS 10118]|uniref:Uncharacterized protein n=1 Tax=Kwoniella bestiolae CBS 10118 TaxID=1296100 RepID=A0A1B9GAH6_9TREE|nr:hypothetical protein I302_02870 [Kwoniella bestiolae CBS 10118]OCF28019.1 hypothetical protein I302_02870 [Kwoniella bestiolae CBS 10118]
MTQIPAGAQLSPVDLPPPPPGADPREPSATLTPRQRGSRTPQRSRSPLASRDASPVRLGGQGRTHSGELGSSPPSLTSISGTGSALQQPIPKSTSGTPSPSVPIQTHSHHLSRPSSPSSIHSSGSAIFERDIEFPPVASLSLNPNPTHQQQHHTLNHKSSRLSHLSHGSALDHTVPAVLDDAVEALTAGGADGLSRGFEGLEIEAPAPSTIGVGAGMARQPSSGLPRKISSGPQSGNNIHSRSPSPISIASKTSSIASPATSPPILGQLNTQQQGGLPGHGQSQLSPTAGEQGFPGTVPRPAMPQRISTGPQVPGGWAFGGGSSAGATSLPAQAESAVAADDRTSSPTSDSPNNAFQTLTPTSLPSHISPNKNKHRISYLSYNDLLLSVPTKVTSLEDITSGNLSPDHLPGTVSPSMSTRSPTMSPHNPLSGDLSPITTTGPGATPPPQGKQVQPKSSFDGHSQRPGALGGLGFGEGEWEREGLGKGLEQRLEEVAQGQTQSQAQ